MSEKEVQIEPLNIVFARAVRICTLIGLGIMVISGLFYLAGVRPYLTVSSVAAHWSKPASMFWKELKHTEISGYSWFLSNLNSMDSLSMIGISFLCLTPLIGIIFIIPRARKIYLILLLILAVEFLFSIIRPLIFNFF